MTTVSSPGRHETRDLCAEPAERERLEHWRRHLVHELEGREEGYSDGRSLIAGRPVADPFSLNGTEPTEPSRPHLRTRSQ